jgi:hypothetical protein
MSRPFALAAALTAVVFLAIYLPDIGHGFISDDYRWIVESRVESVWDAIGLLGKNIGFYRPLVSLTFAADYAVWEANAFGYALTNLLLLGAAAVLLFALARTFGLARGASLVGVGVWLFNFHAVNMALLWISGRTALLASVCALITSHLFLRGRFRLAGAAGLAAMLSKEEAVVLPVLFTAYMWSRGRPGRILTSTWALWGALALYLALRLQSDAFWPGDAPPFYAFTRSPAVIGRNVLEYADRAGTVAVVVILLLFAFTRVRTTAFLEPERHALVFAALWIPAMFALTVLVPVRSSLYALLPSIGSALAVAAVAAVASRVRPEGFSRAAIVLAIAIVALVPVYRSRNVRWVALAELSERVMTTLERDTAGRPSGHVVLVDDPTERFNLDAAFGALFPEAARLRLGDRWSGEVVGHARDARRAGDLTFHLLPAGRLEKVPN